MRPEYLLINTDNADEPGVKYLLKKFGRNHHFIVIGEDEMHYELGDNSYVCNKERLKTGTSIFRLPLQMGFKF